MQMGKGWDHRPHANGNSRAGILFFTDRPVRPISPVGRVDGWNGYRLQAQSIGGHDGRQHCGLLPRPPPPSHDGGPDIRVPARRIDAPASPGLPDHDGPSRDSVRGAGP